MTGAYLDRRVTGTSSGVTVAYSGGNTTWTLPYSESGPMSVVVQATGAVLAVTRPAANQVRVAGDYSNTPVWIGVNFDFYFEPSRLMLRGEDGTPDTRGRLTLGYVDVLYHDTTDFTVTVESPFRPTRTYTFTSPTPATGTFRVPVQRHAEEVTITISSSTPGSCGFTALEWEGSYRSRARAL